MSNDIASYFPIINTLLSSIIGALLVLIINFRLNKPKFDLEKQKINFEIEKIRIETKNLSSAIDDKQEETDDTLEQHQKQLNWTISLLSNIIAYMPGYFAHQTLCQIRDKDNEKYEDINSHKKRILHLLLDNGYLQPPLGMDKIEFTKEVDGKKLFEITELTPMAKLFLQLREEVTKNPTST